MEAKAKKKSVQQENKDKEVDLMAQRKIREDSMSIVMKASENIEVDLKIPKDKSSLGDKELSDLYIKLKTNREFYKAIVNEPKKENKPVSFRYYDAEGKLSKINEAGKQVKEELLKRGITI